MAKVLELFIISELRQFLHFSWIILKYEGWKLNSKRANADINFPFRKLFIWDLSFLLRLVSSHIYTELLWLSSRVMFTYTSSEQPSVARAATVVKWLRLLLPAAQVLRWDGNRGELRKDRAESTFSFNLLVNLNNVFFNFRKLIIPLTASLLLSLWLLIFPIYSNFNLSSANFRSTALQPPLLNILSLAGNL